MENPNFPMELDPDSGACGKRKRGGIEDIPEIDSGGKIVYCGGEISKIDYGGGEIAKIDYGGGEIMKIDSGGGSEKKTRQVEEFDDRYGILEPYKKKMVFEREDYVYVEEERPMTASLFVFDDDDYDSDDSDSSNDEIVQHMDPTPYDHNALLRYISQVRNSSGFDVDTSLPLRLKMGGSPLCFIPMWPHLDDPDDIDYVNEAAKLAIDGINLDNLEMENKTSFELVEVTKAVIVDLPYELLFLTLAVKKVVVEGEEAQVETIRAVVHHPICEPMELHQWMFFKPHPAEA